MRYHDNVVEMIGNTPMVKINNLNKNKNILILAKLEKYNPTGSVKDRIARAMIENTKIDGKTVIEATSGNTGIALAMIAAVKDYDLELVMPKNMSAERRKMLKAFGARLISTPAKRGMDGAIELATKLARKEKYFMPNQFENKANIQAHYETTGKEIWRDTDGKVTHFVAGMGTSGTLMGVSKYLKEQNRDIKIIGVEPFPGSRIQGLKNMDTQKKPKIYNPELIDEKINVSDKDAFRTARSLVRKEGMLMGMSSGAAMYAALKKAEQIKEGVIVVLFPDGGEKYLSTPLFE